MLDKHYRHQDIEAKWYRRWEEAGLFHSEPETERPSYTVVIPPPNITGKLHMGHVLNTTVQDIIIRYKQMSGFNTCWVPGTDHAGIATQNMVEKDLRGQGIDPDNLTREEFLEKVWQWREQYGRIIIQQLRTLGMGVPRRGNDLLRIAGHVAHHEIELRCANGERHGTGEGPWGQVEDNRQCRPATRRRPPYSACTRSRTARWWWTARSLSVP